MEVEEETQIRYATQEEKRAEFRDNVLPAFFNGDNSLSKYLNRRVLVHMEESDRECLLDRLMKIPAGDQIMVFYTLNDLLIRCYVVKRNDGKGGIKLMIEYEDLDMTKELIALRNAKNDPTVRVIFKHLLPPSKEDGGWPSNNFQHPRLKAWYKVFNDYSEYLTKGSRNGNNVSDLWEHDLPVDYAVTRTPLGKKKKIIRFVIHEPYPEVQIGFNMRVMSVPKNNKK